MIRVDHFSPAERAKDEALARRKASRAQDEALERTVAERAAAEAETRGVQTQVKFRR